MAVPRKRHGKARTRKSRSHQGLTRPPFIYCPKCGSTVPPHHICANCGTYRGRTVVATEE